ncbi:hypothetical protein [Flaviaesturariibacter amylovorans]|uniref:DUF4139 domain-containing protein n=1 Tax=Flaviaesturariibacter amylovorans TaxID=1084520 RepID=A0ABP8HRH7_9BACT
MRRVFALLLMLGWAVAGNAKKFDFKLVNFSDKTLAVYIQVGKPDEPGELKFLLNLNPNEIKDLEYKLSKNERVRVYGDYQGQRTLAFERLFDSLSSSASNVVRLILPVPGRIQALGAADVQNRLRNDALLKPFTDSVRFAKGELPPLGSFLFYSPKTGALIALTPTFWKNESTVFRSEKTSRSTQLIVTPKSTEAVGPFLGTLLATASPAGPLELRWDVLNAHTEQWQAGDKSSIQVIQDPSHEYFLRSCMTEINDKKLATGEYQLLFVTGLNFAEKVVVGARSYVSRPVAEEFAFTAAEQEVALPADTTTGSLFVRPRAFQGIDSVSGLSYKVLAVDHTPVLTAFLADQDKTALKAAELKMESLRTAIEDQYSVLQNLDSSLIKTYSLAAIIPIVESLGDIPLRTGATATTPAKGGISDADFNRKAGQFNSVLAEAKQNVVRFKEVRQLVEKLSQPAGNEPARVQLSGNTIEVEAPVLQAYRAQRR